VKPSSGEIPVPIEQSTGIPPIPPDNQLLLVDEQKLVDIEKPHHDDVLCGRGVTTNRHPGNESFRSLVGLNKELYVSSTKREKMSISRSIVRAVRSLDPPGRFLDKDTVTGLWHDIGHKKAVEKTSQALRDGAAMLRKQMSDDLGDPNFLNAVFNDDINKSNEGGKNKKGREKIAIKTDGKENSNNDSKGNSAEKIKVVKAKTAQRKKGHRRVKSNPSALAIATSKSKNNRRYKTQDEPRTPGPDYRWNYNQCPPSPCSPVPRPPHTRSLPSSPMTWGDGPPPYPERHITYSHHHSPYNHPPPSPYSYLSDHGSYTRSHSSEHYHGPPGQDSGLPPRHHSWSPYESSPRHVRYHRHPSQQHYHHHHPPIHRSQSPVQTRSSALPPPSSGPLPPGRHTYSPGDFYSRPAEAEPREPWSPRRGYRHPYETYDSAQPHYSPHHGDYRPERSSNWTPGSNSRNHHDHYYDPDHPDNNECSGGLSVPYLGGERRPSNGRFSPKLHLAPRSNRPMIQESGTPPRPPNYSPQDFRPPTTVSPRYQRSNEDSRYYHCSPMIEEKKTPDMDTTVRSQQSSGDMLSPKVNRALSLSRPEPMKTESRSSPDQEEIERGWTRDGVKKEGKSEYRASPGEFLSKEYEVKPAVKGEDDQSEEAQAVDDIAMSPIPFDREDPVSLMDLPDDILALPISPCGPHDVPALS